MRLSIFAICFSLFLFACIEGKKNKDDWRHKHKNIKKLKHLDLSKSSKFEGSPKDGGVEKINSEKSVNGLIPPMPGNFHRDPSKFNRKMVNKHLKKKKYGHKKHHKKTTWLKIDSGNDCDLECKPGEVCVSGPIDKRPLCVDKKDLKKSVKLFNRFHKKELKPWKKFQKKSHKKSKWLRKQEKRERKKSHDIASLKKHYLKKHGYKHHLDKDFDKYGKNPDLDKIMKEYDQKAKFDKADVEDFMKKHDVKESMETDDGAEHAKHKGIEVYENKSKTEADALAKLDGDECTASQFVQMRTRMMGWFHLLHGQDHLARKAHGGSIAKFYKHVSVKKELREFDGVKCGCLKSAMWQFHLLDKNTDDHLTPNELAVVEENNREPCLKPYLRSCDINSDDKLSSDEWCCCFSHVVAPCFRKVDEIKKANDKDAFIPRCDREGYYMREQCRSDAHNKLQCWCVDINGNELKGTFTEGRAHCSKLAMQSIKNTPFF